VLLNVVWSVVTCTGMVSSPSLNYDKSRGLSSMQANIVWAEPK
jgi:hypothetical protein